MGDAEIRNAELHRKLLDRAGKWKERGIGLLILAALMWGYVAWQLLMPSGAFSGGGGCYGLLFEKPAYGDGSVARCAVERPWPRLLGVLGLSVPVSIVGAVLYTKGSVSMLLSHHAMALTGGRR
ncbi:hypothetical protein [Streptomyces sporangiiformans]|uniref:Uncharacterized protein n=1 Tax=Streptomyces sporangiiformans TaxID=2315329 RepID=A0A505CZT1_9ACTN|nr:hypothetical protein [Streptomyces sporangiiformans]TPQ15860.1 hypothetical protein FGD71_044705 [Streptomyces sporangiiformans]